MLEFYLMAPTVPIEFAGQKESRKYSHSQNMGKSRKYYKAYATGFVPDFRHAVETMGESEGLGSLERVDTELTTSTDSCALKRKCPGMCLTSVVLPIIALVCASF